MIRFSILTFITTSLCCTLNAGSSSEKSEKNVPEWTTPENWEKIDGAWGIFLNPGSSEEEKIQALETIRELGGLHMGES